jgi:NhaP-type Na+/H+ or K+/H+ antiporter
LWGNIDATLILFIFLPALIFGEAMSLNFHRVKEALLSSIILAGPGSIIGTFLLGSLVKYCLFVTWNWTVCFLVGAVLCATDPVGTLQSISIPIY